MTHRISLELVTGTRGLLSGEMRRYKDGVPTVAYAVRSIEEAVKAVVAELDTAMETKCDGDSHAAS